MPIVRIDLLAGRPAERKAELLRRVTEVVASTLGVAPAQVRVLLTEYPPEHWAIGGVAAAPPAPDPSAPVPGALEPDPLVPEDLDPR